MKKQTKLSLNKFKIAKISNFEQGKIAGGNTGDDTITNTKDDIINSSTVVNGQTRCLREQMPD